MIGYDLSYDWIQDDGLSYVNAKSSENGRIN